MKLRRIAFLLGLVPLLAHAGAPASIPIGENSVGPCPGAAITPTDVVQGQFPVELMGSYVMLPFEVPAGTTQVRVKYCWEGPNGPNRHTVDLGIWDAREGEAPWSEPQFRGWGGSSHPDVAISPQGFSSEAEYLADPRGYVPGRTTRGYLPGPIAPGIWAVELGVGAVVSTTEGDEDGLTDWRVEIELSSDPAFAADPYEPAPYDATPANAEPGWYAGDLHVHGEHSALGDATMQLVFDTAFAPIEEGGAGLDFVSLTDYVTSSGWGEIGRYQSAYPGKLILRGSEIITYQGHSMNHATGQYVDHRSGPVYEVDPATGALTLLREAYPPAERFAAITAAGGFTQINHPTHCPSNTAFCRRTCRGCPWDYSDEQTGYGAVDGIEVRSGSPFNYVFTPTALVFWEDALETRFPIAAVGVSDSHSAVVDPEDPNRSMLSAIGESVTVVYAPELSEQGILEGVRAGHTYVKLEGNGGPDLRVDAAGDLGSTGIMGDTIPDGAANLHVTVTNVFLEEAELPNVLRLLQDGVSVEQVDVVAPGGDHVFRAGMPGVYRVQLERADGTIVALASAIAVPEPSSAAGCAVVALALVARRLRAARAGRAAFATGWC